MSRMEAEALRYLGARDADARTSALIREGFAQLEAAPPRHVLVRYPAQTVHEAFESKALDAYLAGAKEAALLAATLGVDADRLIRRAEAQSALHAAVLHACAAAKIEAYCDTVQAGLAGAGASRFSPGYGDFALSKQQRLLTLTDAPKRIGLFLTDGDMLAPSKSITAVIALGKPEAACPLPKCRRCDKMDCAFRRAEPAGHT